MNNKFKINKAIVLNREEKIVMKHVVNKNAHLKVKI